MAKSREGLITVPNKGRYRFVVGIDFNHPRAHNTMGYIRLADYDEKEKNGRHPSVGQDVIWLNLKDFDRLGTLMILYARIFAKTHPKGEEWEEEAMKFVEFWRKLRNEWPEVKPFIPESEAED
jgi:hypothetical protein